MYSGYSTDEVAAYEVVDDSQQGTLIHLTPEQRTEMEVQSIIELAQQEHEVLIYQQVIAAMKIREEQELARQRDINHFLQSFTRNNEYRDGLLDLLDLSSSSEESSDED
ncbi:hypothetical protein KR009_002936 [Drosophila setifemur]|nr:hypothetical protein KR009_002936 [Drosophila setifemur]